MDKRKYTHLILGSPGGKKHKYAKRWGFTIVNAQWVDDSVKKGFAQLCTLDKSRDDKIFKSLKTIILALFRFC